MSKKAVPVPRDTILYGRSEELMKQLPNSSIDLAICSPPYADTLSYGTGIKNLTPEEYPAWFTGLAKDIGRVLKPTGSFILNINDRCEGKLRSIYVFETICKIVRETDLKLYDRYVWIKRSGLPSGRDYRLTDRLEYIWHFCKDPDKFKNFPDAARVPHAPTSLERHKYEVQGNDKVDDTGRTLTNKKMVDINPAGCLHTTVFYFNTAAQETLENRGCKSFHPAPFNEELPTFFINWLTKKDDIVLDPFMGSGTTAVSAIKLRRGYIGMELNEAYKKDVDNRILARKNDMASQFDFGTS